jgi:hypothetical protein
MVNGAGRGKRKRRCAGMTRERLKGGKISVSDVTRELERLEWKTQPIPDFHI